MNLLLRPFEVLAALRTRRLPRAVAVMAVVAALAGACSGDDGNGSSPTGAATAAGPTEAPASTTRPPGATGPTGPTGANLPTPGTIRNLPSYRYSLSMEGKGSIVNDVPLPDVNGGSSGDTFKFSVKGAWIAPDKAQLEMDFAGQSLKQTVIGKEQWLNVAGMAQGPLPADGTAFDLVLIADIFDQAEVQRTLESLDCGKAEDVNGVGAVRCDGDLNTFKQNPQTLGGILSETDVKEVTSYRTTVWIARDGGYAVKAEMQMAGKMQDGKDFSLAMNFDITDIGKVTEIKP